MGIFRGIIRLLLIPLVVFLVLAILSSSPGGLLWRSEENHIPDGPIVLSDPFESGIRYVRWGYGGGELGGSHVYTLRCDKDGSATLEVFLREEWDAPEETASFGVDPSTLDRIADLAREADLMTAQYNGGENYVLDGDTWSLTIELNDGGRISLEEYQDFDDREYEAIFAIRDILVGLYEDVDS